VLTHSARYLSEFAFVKSDDDSLGGIGVSCPFVTCGTFLGEPDSDWAVLFEVDGVCEPAKSDIPVPEDVEPAGGLFNAAARASTDSG
jgi:hypothetical protein